MKPIMEDLYLYQSDIYQVTQKAKDLILIELNDGREIHIKARPTNFGYGSILDCRVKELGDN